MGHKSCKSAFHLASCAHSHQSKAVETRRTTATVKKKFQCTPGENRAGGSTGNELPRHRIRSAARGSPWCARRGEGQGSPKPEARGKEATRPVSRATVPHTSAARERPMARTGLHSSTLRLFDSSTLRLFDSSTLRLFDSSTLRLFDSSTLRLTRSHWRPRQSFSILRTRPPQRFESAFGFGSCSKALSRELVLLVRVT